MERVANAWHPLLIRLGRVTSTQTWMREWAQMGADEGLALLAREQTAGRGRFTRVWESPPGGLYLSVLLRPHLRLSQAQQVTMLVSLAAIDACQSVAGIRAKPKWPNDLFWGRKKLAGVLTELESTDRDLRYAVVGLGLNVNNDFSTGPLADTAISLRQITGRQHDIDALATAFMEALGQRYAALRAGISPHRAWARRLEPLGRQVMVQQPGQAPLSGRAQSVSPEGALLIRDETGLLHTIWAGDIIIQW